MSLMISVIPDFSSEGQVKVTAATTPRKKGWFEAVLEPTFCDNTPF